MSYKPLDAMGFDSSRGVGKHDFVRFPSGMKDEEFARLEKLKAEEAHRNAVMEARLRDERALIFQNILHGVPEWRLAEEFHKSVDDITAIFWFVMRKIRSRCVERLERPIEGVTIDEIKRSKRRCLTILPLINLDRDPKHTKVSFEPVELARDGSMRALGHTIGQLKLKT
jgi:hypothetical protein